MVRLAELLNEGKSVFIEFYATWCPHCQRMRPIIEDLREKEQGKIKFATYDIDDPANRQLIEYYRVQSVPTMLMFQDGEQVWRKSGELMAEELEKVMEKYR